MLTRALSYIAFLGIFSYLYGATDGARRHGRRGATIFVLEVLAFVVADVVRLKAGWPPALTFGALFVVLSGIKVFIIINALGDGRGRAAAAPAA